MRRRLSAVIESSRVEAADAPRLDLDEDRRAAVADDQVDLPGEGAVVALEEREPEALVVLEREALAEAPDDLVRRLGHRSTLAVPNRRLMKKCDENETGR